MAAYISPHGASFSPAPLTTVKLSRLQTLTHSCLCNLYSLSCFPSTGIVEQKPAKNKNESTCCYVNRESFMHTGTTNPGFPNRTMPKDTVLSTLLVTLSAVQFWQPIPFWASSRFQHHNALPMADCSTAFSALWVWRFLSCLVQRVWWALWAQSSCVRLPAPHICVPQHHGQKAIRSHKYWVKMGNSYPKNSKLQQIMLKK